MRLSFVVLLFTLVLAAPALAQNRPPAVPFLETLEIEDVDGGLIEPGDQLVVAVTVKAGPRPTAPITEIDLMPLMRFEGGEGPPGTTFTTAQNRLTVRFPTIDVGAPTTARVTVRVPQRVPDMTTFHFNFEERKWPITVHTPLVGIRMARSGELAPGAEVRYALEIDNHGSAPARHPLVSDTPVAGLEPVSLSGAGFTCGALSCRYDGELAPGEKATLTFVARVLPDAEGDVRNEARVETTGDAADIDDTAFDAGPAVLRADLALTATAPEPVSGGDRVDFALKVSNRGPARSRDIVVTDSLPTGLDMIDAGEGCTVDGQLVTCTLESLAAGGEHTFRVGARVFPVGSSFETTAVVRSGSTPDPDEANNHATPTVAVLAADVRVSVERLGEVPTVGGTVMFRARITNAGPGTARQVLLNTWFIGAERPDVPPRLGDLAPGETKTVDYRGIVHADADRIIAAAIAMSLAGHVNAYAETPVHRSAELSLRVEAGATRVERGAPFTLGLSATNAGPGVAYGAQVRSELPEGVTVVEAPQGCAVADRTLTCTLGDMARGEGAARVITVRADALGTLRLAARVSSRTPDADGADDTGSVDVAVEGETDLELTKTASTTTAKPGDQVVYTLTVTNRGERRATGVTVADVLPDGLTYVSGCDRTCSLGDIEPGDSATATVMATVAPLASLPATERHTLRSTRVEARREIAAGRTETLAASCADGSVATDATVTGDDLFGVIGLDVRAVRPSGDGYEAVVRNGAAFRAKARLTVTCVSLSGHALVIGAPVTSTGTGELRLQCAPGQTPVAPFFTLESGARLTSADDTRFKIAGGSATVGVHCLEPLTTEADGHVHRLSVERGGLAELLNSLLPWVPRLCGGQSVSLGTACAAQHTSGPIAVRTITNEATVRSQTPDRDPANDTARAAVKVIAG